MRTLKKLVLCKFAALFLCFLLGFPMQELAAVQDMNPAQVWSQSKQLYQAGEYETAKTNLNGLIEKTPESDLEHRSMLAQYYLLLGASHEKLAELEPAEACYKKAKDLLAGNDPAVNGVLFTDLTLFGTVFGSTEAMPPQAQEMTNDDDPLMKELKAAKELYFKEDYKGAREKLDKMVAELAKVEGRDMLKGEAYLMLGASHEKLKYKEISIRYYCKAKDILGEGKTTEGLELKTLKLYKKKCPVAGDYAAKQGTKKKGGGLIGTLIGLALLGGVIWYLFINKNSPLKKKDEEKNDDNNNSVIVYENAYEMWNCWYAYVHAYNTTVVPDINNDYNPDPNFNNNYDDESTCTITGENIDEWYVQLTITACKNLTRRDQIWIDDVLALDETNTFPKACTGDTIDPNDFCEAPQDYPQRDYKQWRVHSGSGTASFRIRHKITFTTATGQEISKEEVVVFNNSSSQAVIK